MKMDERKLKGPGYYDAVYGKMVVKKGDSLAWIRERYGLVARYVKGSVLDLGCGLGFIADQIKGAEYLGVDFSEFAIEHCRAKVRNPQARFEVADLRKWKPPSQFDTVLLLEVLEHVTDPAELAQLALRSARKRIIATAPRDMPGRAHVWPTWTQADIEAILGKLAQCFLFGGEEDDMWWLAVKDIE